MRVESICLGRLFTNAYLVETAQGTVLIDPADASPELLHFIGKRKVDWVLNTHGHFDHVGGNWAIQKQGAKVALHEADLPYLDHAHPGHAPVDRFLDEGEEIAGLRVLHTPGHSPGSVVLLANGVLFAGDLLFAGSIGRTDFPGGSPKAMEESLRRILELDSGLRILPGHGPETTLARERKTNPYLVDLGG